METILLKPLLHKNAACIALMLAHHKELNQYIKKEAKARWSRTHKCWWIPCTEESYTLLCNTLAGKAILQTKELKAYLEKKKGKTFSHQLPATDRKPAPITNKQTTQKQPLPTIIANKISSKNKEALDNCRQHLVLKSYSPSTIKTYLNELSQFLQVIGKTPAEEFTVNRIKDYLQYCHEKLQLSENTLHSRMNALKFYYEQVLGKEKFFWEIPRPKKAAILPKLISKERIADLINAIENVKHKTIIMLTYACGLRVSEVVSLKVKNIDGQRKTIFIERAKGKKDRVLSLNPNMLIMLREYYKQYKPKEYLFEGQFENEHLSERSMQQVIQKAKRKAGIIQDGSMHMLRHSFATHLLDKGIDVVFIQKLLGHSNIKNTLRYLHVTNKDLVHILSPLEDIEGLLKK